ncbi:MAG: hypothetical protein ABSE52_07545 [Candidatus Dormibacteria bacterium]
MALSVLSWFLQTYLLAASALKIYATSRAVVWLPTRGPKYRVSMETQRPEERGEMDVRIRMLSGTGGLFFPFGVRDYRLRAWAADGATSRASLRRLTPISFNWPFLVLLSAITLPLLVSGGSQLQRWIALVTILLLMGEALAIGAELALSYLMLGSYGVSVHNLVPFTASAERRAFAESMAFLGAVGMSYIAVATGLLVTAHAFGGLRGIQYPHAAGPFLPSGIGNSFYYALLIFLQQGNPGPVNGQGKAVVALASAVGAAYLLMIVGLVVGFVREARTPRLPS